MLKQLTLFSKGAACYLPLSIDQGFKADLLDKLIVEILGVHENIKVSRG